IRAIIAAAAKNDRPKTAPPCAVNDRKLRAWLEKTIRPKMARTMLGVPATISTPDSPARASQHGRPHATLCAPRHDADPPARPARRQAGGGPDPVHQRPRRARVAGPRAPLRR